jgi:hypothetical protein
MAFATPFVETWALRGTRHVVWLERAFVIIGFLRNPPKWRYRLGVRTEDSQSSNPGSIPGSATNKSEVQRNLPVLS